MKMNIMCCKRCPFFQGAVTGLATCAHSDVPKTADYPVPRSITKIDPIPKWCPIQNSPTLIKRNSEGKIVSEVKLVLIGKIQE